MEFPGKQNEHNDALDEILRRYLLENDPETEEGESLMEMAGESVLSTPPLVMPSASKEAAMLDRLKENFPSGSGAPAVASSTGGWTLLKSSLVGAGALAVLTTLILLFTNPFAEKPNEYTIQLKTDALPELNTLARVKGNQPREENMVAIEEITSLQIGEGNPMLVQEGTERTNNSKGGRGSALTYGAPNPAMESMQEDKSVPAPLVSSPDLAVLPPIAHPAMVAPDPFPLRSLYAQTTTTSNYYQLESKEDHLIEAQKGTLLHIPKDAFVTMGGERVKGPVQLEIKEVYDKSEYIKSNLPTVSNGRQLISGGVLYVEASSQGRPLKLARNKDIYVEFAANSKVDTRDMQLWEGEFDGQGQMNWVPVGGLADKLVPLPLDEIYFDEFWCDCKGEKLWNRTLWEITDESFSNSWIATREFRQRLRMLRDVGYYEEGLTYYRDHIREPLWKVDQAVAGMLKVEASEGKGKETDADHFHRFAQDLLTYSESFQDHGVDLGRWDARRQLLYRRVSREESERLLRLYDLREKFVGEIESRLYLAENNGSKYVKGIRPGKYRTPGSESTKGFLLTHLGWTNLDKVADPMFAGGQGRKVKVRLTGEVPLDARKTPFEPVSTFLVYSDINSVIPGSLITGQYSTFKNVPHNMDGWVVAIGYQGAMPYIGISKLQGDRSNLIVEMRPTTLEGYLTQLQRLDT